MKKCLNCNVIYKSKRESAKYCSGKCRVQWNRKNPKKDKPLTELQQITILYNSLIEKIDKLSILKSEYINPINYSPPVKEENKKIFIKRSPLNWVELRKECQDPADYAIWLNDLDNDIHLTILEKKQIKATT